MSFEKMKKHASIFGRMPAISKALRAMLANQELQTKDVAKRFAIRVDGDADLAAA